MPHIMKSGKLACLGQFVSLSYYTSVRAQRKQHVHWSCLGKQFVFSNKPNIYTPNLHFFPLVPSGNSSYDGIRFLSDQSCVWAAGSGQSNPAFLWRFSI